MLTLDPLGSVTGLAVADSACVEEDGTYDLIFTGAHTVAAAGTYTILDNVITAVVLTAGGAGYAAAPAVATQTGDGAVTASFVSLATSQDLQTRRPLVEIVSAQRTDDIPFDGSFLTSETFNEFGCNLIPHSSGRLAIAYCYGPDADGDCGIKYVFTDLGRTEFTTVTIELYTSANYVMKGVSLCELTGGNIGLVCLVNDTANHVYRLLRRIITVTGAAVSSAEIANWSHDTITSDPWVAAIAPNSYLLVYGTKSGSDYFIYKRTSADFLTWSAESALSIAGLTSTWRLANPSIIKISTGDLWLWFDALESVGPGGEELTNVYCSISANAGATWGAAAKMTAYDSYSEIGGHPMAVQKVANTMALIYTRKVGALHMDDTATGWPTGDCTTELSWDSVNRKLYAVNIFNATGSKGLQCIVKIDVDTWTVDQYWDGTTTPGFPAWICGGSTALHPIWYGTGVHDGCHMALATKEAPTSVWHLDGEANTITAYNFDTDASHSVVANVSAGPAGNIAGQQVDFANERIWLLFNDDSSPAHTLTIGYLDLSEASDYQFHTVVAYAGLTRNELLVSLGASGWGGMYIDVEENYAVVTGAPFSTAVTGFCVVFDLSTGGLIVKWNSTDTDFPRFGLTLPFVYAGKIYAGIGVYTADYSQSSFRGLAEIDIASEQITLHRPTYCSDDSHSFGRPAYLQDGKIAMTHSVYGVAVFDMIAKTWQLFGNTTLAGFTKDGVEISAKSQVVYDDVNDLVMVGDPYYPPFKSANGVIMFSINGFIRQSYYSLGTNPGGGWSFGEAAQLIQGFLDYDAGAAVEPGSSTAMFVFWINEDTAAEKSIKWDKDGSSLDISGYLISGEDVAARHTIDGNPASLSFRVSHGHLFDPYNLSSLLSPVLKKGRKLTLRWGEKIGGTDYWQNAGTFYVLSTSMQLRRGEYPGMAVEAEDQRTLWRNSHVDATAIYNNTPKEILDSILGTFADLAVGDLAIPVFTGSTNLQMQWIDTTLDEIIAQICNRFGYYFRFDVDGKASARQISNAAAVDHAYTDSTKIIRFSPDDKYSDFTNQVTVQGQEVDFTQVTFPEERISQVSGTLGWWGCKSDHIVWFSDDKSRRCVNPRMNALETAVSIPFKLAGSVNEYLTECDAAGDNKYCTVYVEAPNLIPLLAAAIALYIVGNQQGDLVLAWGGGYTICVGRRIEGVALMAAMMILGSTANYQLEVWAQPLGSVRRSVQGTWNDVEHQTEIGSVINQTLTDPLCYSAADCLAVATFEGLVARMQRRRIVVEKVAHLQDEEGDTIRIVHPYSGKTIDLFVTDITRKYKKPASGSEEGGFYDTIEGWVVSQ